MLLNLLILLYCMTNLYLYVLIKHILPTYLIMLIGLFFAFIIILLLYIFCQYYYLLLSKLLKRTLDCITSFLYFYFIPLLIIFSNGLYVSFDNNSFDINIPLYFFILYVILFTPLNPFCSTISIPFFSVLSSI